MSLAPTRLLLFVEALTQEGDKEKGLEGEWNAEAGSATLVSDHEGPNAASALLGCVALGWCHPMSQPLLLCLL